MERLVLILAMTVLVTLAQAQQYKLVCYFSNWSQYRLFPFRYFPKDIDPFLCTHLNYAFARLIGNTIVSYEWNDESTPWSLGHYQRVINYKQQNPNLKILLALGGWTHGSGPFSRMVATDANIDEFAQNCIDFLRARDFDGVDIDWEYPGSRDGSDPVNDKQRYTVFLRKMRAAFNAEAVRTSREPLLLAAAVAAGKGNIDRGYDFPALGEYLDFVNIMSYDYHGQWDDYVGINAPLYGRRGEEGDRVYLNQNWTINYYIDNGVPREKIVMGVATFGRSFTLRSSLNTRVGDQAISGGTKGRYTRETGYLAYYEICQHLNNDVPSERWTREWDDQQFSPFAYWRDQWVGYDDRESLEIKTDYIVANELGGAMVWELASDDFRNDCNEGTYPLIRTIKSTLERGSSGQTPGPPTTPTTRTPTTTTIVPTTPTTPKPTTPKPTTPKPTTPKPTTPKPTTPKPTTPKPTTPKPTTPKPTTPKPTTPKPTTPKPTTPKPTTPKPTTPKPTTPKPTTPKPTTPKPTTPKPTTPKPTTPKPTTPKPTTPKPTTPKPTTPKPTTPKPTTPKPTTPTSTTKSTTRFIPPFWTTTTRSVSPTTTTTRRTVSPSTPVPIQSGKRRSGGGFQNFTVLCSHAGMLLPYNPDCTRFVQCVYLRPELLFYVMDCQPGLVFSVRQGACDFPDNVPDCTQVTTTTTTPTNTTTLTSPPPPVTSTLSPVTSTPSPVMSTPSPVLSNQGRSVNSDFPKVQDSVPSASPGLDIPALSVTSPDPDISTPPYERNKPRAGFTANTTEVSQICNPGNINVENNADCSTYVACVFWKLHYVMPCPAGLYYNRAGYCDWPSNVPECNY